MKKYIVLIFVIVIAIVTIIAYKAYNRKPVNLVNAKATSTFIVDSLVSIFENNEATANKLYLGKVIAVSGNIVEIKNVHDTFVNIILGKPENLHNVSCTMNIEDLQKIKSLIVNTNVAIKGICTGFLADVELNRCVINIENK